MPMTGWWPQMPFRGVQVATQRKADLPVWGCIMRACADSLLEAVTIIRNRPAVTTPGCFISDLERLHSCFLSQECFGGEF